jgi:hypothetical protein
MIKYFISFLLRYPLYYITTNGISALFGMNLWVCVPIAIGIVVLHEIGQKIERDVW